MLKDGPMLSPGARATPADDLWHLECTVNGQPVSADVPCDCSLLFFLREHLGLSGTKGSCLEGECGSCTVLLDDKPINSCLVLAMDADGGAVTTIEGLTQDRQLSVIQQAFVDCFAAQCGYCTPGMIMAAKALLDQNPTPSRDEIIAGISGNLCRCTGYYQIVDAIELAARRLGGETP